MLHACLSAPDRHLSQNANRYTGDGRKTGRPKSNEDLSKAAEDAALETSSPCRASIYHLMSVHKYPRLDNESLLLKEMDKLLVKL